MAINKLFIIVLYNCNILESKSFISISLSLGSAKEKAFLFIYDNSDRKQEISINDKCWDSVSYLHDCANSGISKAYNTGADYAKTLNVDWIVLLDQDTNFALDYVPQLNMASRKHDDIVLFAPILELESGDRFSPSRYKFKQSNLVKLDPGIYSLRKYSPVNSGLAIDLAAFNHVGGYLEKVKLDFADFQFIERLRRKYTKFCLIDSTAIQDFSNDDLNVEKAIFRFKIYLHCAKYCYRRSLIDDFLYFYTTIRHTTGLMLKFKNFIFVEIFYLNYLKNCK